MSISADVTVLPFSTQTDEEVQQELSTYQIGLTVDEARKITELLGRDPTLVEAVVWGIQGSEHCSYKSSRRFLKQFLTDGKHIILGPVEDSGIVAITDGPDGKRWGLTISHESHNHPSQIVPYEGAATGVGGVMRDIVCMGARVVGCMDMLRLGDPNSEEAKSIANEVVRGIGGYGNPLGIPNLGGDTVFDESYNSNCLVNALGLGIVREDEIIHSYAPAEAGEVGYDIILVGKPTDRSGFGGAAFASVSMEEEKREQNSGAVQEPNPFLERHLLASTYALFDWIFANGYGDKVSMKDLGAGGVVCASVEQVADVGMGANVQLENVHVSLDNLQPEVIACAETQERLCWICHPDLTDHIIKHYNEDWDLPSITEHARASVIGKVTSDPTYEITYNGTTILQANAEDITSGLQYKRPTDSAEITHAEPEITSTSSGIEFESTAFSYTEVLQAMLSHPNGASKEPAFVHFDKTVIGNTVVEAGEADAGVIAPLQDIQSYVHQGEHPSWELSEADAKKGVAVAADGNGRYGRISPYWQGVNATVEAMRNVVAVGATPRALTDCLNYGNPEIPEQLWQLEEGVRGIAEVGKTMTFEGEAVPVISGNVSLYNGKPDGSAIDPTAIVCCVGIMDDAFAAKTMQVQKDNSAIVLVGKRKPECGGSLYYQALEARTNAKQPIVGMSVPQPDLQESLRQMQAVLDAHNKGIVRSCHDISDGGLAMSLFEMTNPQRKVGGNIGLEVDITGIYEDSCSLADVLFSQTGGFLLEMSKEDAEAFTSSTDDAWIIGSTTTDSVLKIASTECVFIEEQLAVLHTLWKEGLKEVL